MKVVTLLVIYLACVLGCYKYCNGHGNCGPKDKCECYLGWGGADCSLRSCPYGEALIDIPLGDLNHDGSVSDAAVMTEWRPKYGISENLKGYVTKSRAHRYAECSNSGSCNRESGECECYKGYEGSACQRRSCPTSVDGVSCSGNGICMSSTAFAKEQGSSYYGWELDKFYTCKCDAGYEGVDCSLRQCPYGLDPIEFAGSKMTYTLTTTETDKLKDDYYFQVIYDGTIYPTPVISTIPTGICTANGKDASAANNYQEIMRRALITIPPLAQASVKIECDNTPSKIKTITITAESADAVKFYNSPLIAINPKTPTIDLFTGGVKGVVTESDGTTTITPSDAAALCSQRGLCDSKTGICNCFTGYYGYACENQRTINL